MIIGIDPGVSGAIALLDDRVYVSAHDMPYVVRATQQRKFRETDPAGLASLLISIVPDHHYAAPEVYVERQAPMEGQGVASMFSIGRAQGAIEGVCAGLGWQCVLVSAQRWKRAADLWGVADKGASIERALALYPSSIAALTKRSHHGRADAILIAHFGHFLQQEVAA